MGSYPNFAPLSRRAYLRPAMDDEQIIATLEARAFLAEQPDLSEPAFEPVPGMVRYVRKPKRRWWKRKRKEAKANPYAPSTMTVRQIPLSPKAQESLSFSSRPPPENQRSYR